MNSEVKTTISRLFEQKQLVADRFNRFERTVNDRAELFLKLGELNLEPSFDSRDGCINLVFDGNSKKLEKVWSELRRSGYMPDHRPAEKESIVSCFWHSEGLAPIWMLFSSSVCRRVQIGTTMVERPIYETQCGEEAEPVLLDQADEQI